jgi:chitinase
VHVTSTITQLPAFAWDAVPGAVGYVVYREGVPLPQVTGTSYEEPDVSQPPVSYTYYVRAVNHVGVQGDASESVTIAYNPYPVVS